MLLTYFQILEKFCNLRRHRLLPLRQLERGLHGEFVDVLKLYIIFKDVFKNLLNEWIRINSVHKSHNQQTPRRRHLTFLLRTKSFKLDKKNVREGHFFYWISLGDFFCSNIVGRLIIGIFCVEVEFWPYLYLFRFEKFQIFKDRANPPKNW